MKEQTNEHQVNLDHIERTVKDMERELVALVSNTRTALSCLRYIQRELEKLKVAAIRAEIQKEKATHE